MTFQESRVGKLERENPSKSWPPSATTDGVPNPKELCPPPPAGCWWWWSSKKADVSNVGKRYPPAWSRFTTPTGLCGSGLSTEPVGICPPANRIPVTCCTICRKFDGSAVMKVVGERFETRGLRFAIFPLGGDGFGFRGTRFETVSGSDPPELETLCP